MTPRRILLAVLVLLVTGVLALFYLQNVDTRVDVVFRLPGVAWYLAQDSPLPLLLGISLLSGLVLSGLYFGVASARKSRKIRALGREVSALEDDLALARLDQGGPTASASSEPAASGGDDSVSAEEATDFDELI